LLKQPKVLIFDEATSNLDSQTAEYFGKTTNALKGQVTMLFITHALPKGLQIDEVIQIGGKGADQERHFGVVAGANTKTYHPNPMV
jgi:ATP-binding cassette, subfamily B, bacterial HlyB/CyaB